MEPISSIPEIDSLSFERPIAGMIRCIYISFIIKLSCSPFLSIPCRMRGTKYHPMNAGTNLALVVSDRDNNKAHGSSKNEVTICLGTHGRLTNSSASTLLKAPRLCIMSTKHIAMQPSTFQMRFALFW
jgi:hypothetical protein